MTDSSIDELFPPLVALSEVVRNPTSDPLKSDPFHELVEKALERYDRYRHHRPAAQEFKPPLERSDCREHVKSFLHHSKFVAMPPTNNQSIQEFATRLDAEFRREQCGVTNLVVLDGLELPEKEIVFSGGRLVELNDEFLDSWFGSRDLPGPLKLADLDGVAALEVATTGNNPPFGPGYIEWDTPATHIRRAASPWLTYLNLFSDGKCAGIGLYQRSDSLLHVDQIVAVGVRAPMWVDDSWYDDEIGDYRQAEKLYRTLAVEDGAALKTLLNCLIAGGLAATGRSHRVETALRYFDRVSENYLSHVSLPVLIHQMDALEDIVVHAVVGLEAIYLDGEQSKGPNIATRSSMILEANPKLRRSFRRNIDSLYNLRSAIVHGNERQKASELLKGAVSLEEIFRRSLVAFLLLDGAHERLRLGSQDGDAAETVRDAITQKLSQV